MGEARKILERKGLTKEQVEAGVKYYENFGRHFWSPKKAVSKFLKLLREQKEGYRE